MPIKAHFFEKSAPKCRAARKTRLFFEKSTKNGLFFAKSIDFLARAAVQRAGGRFLRDFRGGMCHVPRNSNEGQEDAMKVPLLDLKPQYEQIRAEIEPMVLEICKSQAFILGPKVQECEAAVAAYCQAAHGVGCFLESARTKFGVWDHGLSRQAAGRFRTTYF